MSANRKLIMTIAIVIVACAVGFTAATAVNYFNDWRVFMGKY